MKIFAFFIFWLLLRKAFHIKCEIEQFPLDSDREALNASRCLDVAFNRSHVCTQFFSIYFWNVQFPSVAIYTKHRVGR